MIKSAVIFALDDIGAQPIFGMPAARRLVLLARKTGVEQIHVVGDIEPLLPVLSDLLPREAFHAAADDESLTRMADSLELAADDKVLLMRASHVIDQRSFSEFMETARGRNTYALMTDATSLDGGIYLTNPPGLASLLNILWSGETVSTHNDHVAALYTQSGLPYVMQKGPASSAFAEAKLVETLSAQTQNDDGFMARHFDRRISRFISRRIAHTRITPNAITLLGMSIGLCGALLLSRPGYWVQLLGSLLFLFCVMVDGVDGEVARLKFKESTFGHYLDVITDNLVHVAIFVGIAWGLYQDTGNRSYLIALWFLMGGFGLCVIAVYQCILVLNAKELQQSPLLIRLMSLMASRDFAYLVVFLAVIGHLAWFLTGAAVGTYLFAAILWFVSISAKHKRVITSY